LSKKIHGRPPFGLLSGPVGPVERGAFELRKPTGGKAGWWSRRFGFKHFQYMGAVSHDLFVGCAIVDAGLVVDVFGYMFDPRTRRMQKRGWESALGRGFRYNPDPDRGVSRFSSRHGSVTMSAERDADGETQTKTLQAELASDLSIDLSFEDGPPFEPMRICTQTGVNGWTYAQKVAGVPARGTVRGQLGEFDLQEINAFAHHDFTVGYLRRETSWHWACLSGVAGSGETLGLNVSCGVNETAFTENCIWHDGRLLKVDTVFFDFDDDALEEPWEITSHDGKVALRFTPLGAYRVQRNAWIAAANFQQLFGRFDGILRCDGREVVIDGMHGFAERQYLRW
jgi:hypothetical protein